MNSFPLVSVIITTKNEEKNIGSCLKSIKKQSYKNIEIIVVDNFSTDKTKEIATSFSHSRESGNPVPSVIHFFEKGPERSAQRNLGIKKAKGKYVLYLDADMRMSKNVIKDSVKKIQRDTKIVGLYISEIVMGKSFWCKVRRFERTFYDGTVIDCVRFISKKIFAKVRGFDESMSGPEDWDFDKKIRHIGKTALIKTPIYHNESNFNLLQYLKKKSYYIKSFGKYIKKWGRNDSDIRKQFGACYRFIGVFTENGKWKKLFAHPILTFVMYFLRILVGTNYMLKKTKE